NRNEPVTASLSMDDLVEEKPEFALFSFRRAQETELPNTLSLAFLEADGEYRRAAVTARKLTGHSQRQEVREAAMVMDRQSAQQRAAIALHEIWAGRETAGFTLPQGLAELEPGDIIELETGPSRRLLRIEEVSEKTGRAITARLVNPQVYAGAPPAPREGSASLAAIAGAPRLELLDLPLLSAADNPYAAWLAVTARPWPGSVSLLESTGGGFSLLESYGAPAIMGEVTTALAKGPLSRLDHANRLSVKLASGELSSVSLSELFAGANVAAVGSQQTGWEVLQFANAVLTGPDTYELSLLLRGQAGSGPQMADLRPAGAVFVLLDDAVRQIPASASDIGRERLLRAGPSTLDHAAPAYVGFTHTAAGLGLQPLSPVHLKAVKSSGGITLSWIRRTRIDGDNWALNEVPLGEASEQYTIDIMNAGAPVRTLVSATTSIVYSDADREADFGLPLPAILTFRVAQVSQLYGPGAFEEKTVNV
ncbi:MAG TPA: hypothetical protein ENJ99_07470, partial [Rhizobiales bacterium]|nr:hypothetical protein [Hyphomicrobiales bacterium]